MASTAIETIGTLTIPSGAFQTSSLFLSQSDFARFAAISIFPSGNLVGTATLRASPISSPPSWSVVNVNNVPVTVTAGTTVYLVNVPFETLQLSSSLPQSGSTTFYFQGQLNVTLGAGSARA